MSRRSARIAARQAVIALLEVNIETQDGDLFVSVDDMTVDERTAFDNELGCIVNRLIKWYRL